MKRALLLLLAAIAALAAGGIALAVSSGLAITTGLYWAVETATTVGYGDVTPHNPAGRVVAVLVMLITIPLLASVFALLTSLHVRKHTKSMLDEHHDAIHQKLDAILLSGGGS